MTLTAAGSGTTWNFDRAGHRMTTIGNWDFEYWSDGGTATMVVNSDGTFSGTWDGRTGRNSNILFRSGRKFGDSATITRTHKEIGEITMTFDASHTPQNQNSLLCVYGWTARQTMEYYIIESWGSYAKGRQGACTLSHDHVAANCRRPYLVTTYTIPGEGTYQLYVSHERVNQPSIFSNNDTFPQYIAIRTERRTNGTISVSEHFRRWEAAGLTHMGGALFEVAFCVEAWGSAGSAVVNSLTLDIGEYKSDGNGQNQSDSDISIPANRFRPSSTIGAGTVNTEGGIVTVIYGDRNYGNVYTWFDVTFPPGTNITDYRSIDFDFRFLGGDLGDQKRLFVLAGTPSSLTGFIEDVDIGAWNVDNPTLGIAPFTVINSLDPFKFDEAFIPAHSVALAELSTVRFAIYVPAFETGNDGGANVPTRFEISNVVLRAFIEQCEVCTPSAADCMACEDCGRPLTDAEHVRSTADCRKCADCDYAFASEPCGVCPVCLCEHKSYGWVRNKCVIAWACTLCGRYEWANGICSWEDVRQGCTLSWKCMNKDGCGSVGEWDSCAWDNIEWDGLKGACVLCDKEAVMRCWNIGNEGIECKVGWESDGCGSYGDCTVCGAGHIRPCEPQEAASDGCGRSSTCKLCGMEDSWFVCYDVDWSWAKTLGVCHGRGVCKGCESEHFGTCWQRGTADRCEETDTIFCTECEHVWQVIIEKPADCVTHDFGGWVTTRPATRTAEGERERECRVCGGKETGTIARLQSSGGGGGGGSGSGSSQPVSEPAPAAPTPFAIPAAAITAAAGTLPSTQHRITTTGRQIIETGSADNAGQNALLVRMNTDGELEVVSSAIINADGNASMNITQTGDYIVLVRRTGDITGTGEVETADALALLRHVAGISELNPIQLFVANGKAGDVNTTDALNILKMVAGL
jgi:hypothetical protein